MFVYPYIADQIDISHYNYCYQLKAGGFSVVHLVEDDRTQTKYAAKVIDPNKINTQKIFREISILANVKHPTIISCIGYSLIDFEREEKPTIILEYAENGSLADFLKRDEIDNTTKQNILIGICRGMKYLHDRNIIHRDLKPGNILIDSNFKPKISDFGLSKKYELGDSFSQSESEIGTLVYMAPEVIEGVFYDFKIDVYSFGILLYEVVTNLFPYPDLLDDRINVFNFCRKVVENDYRPDLSNVNNSFLRQLIEACLQQSADLRPTFKEIYEKLAFNENYYLDSVNVDEINNYTNEISIINDPLEKMIVKNDKFEIENNQFRKDNKNLLRKFNHVQLKQLKLEKRINQIMKVNLELLNNAKEFDIFKKQLTREAKQKSDENEKLRTDLSKLKAEKKDLTSKKDELTKRVDDLTLETIELKREKGKLIRNLNKLQKSIIAKKRENEEDNEKQIIINELNETIVQKENENTVLLNTVNNLNTDKIQNQKEIECLNHKIELNDAENNNLKAENNILKENNLHLTNLTNQYEINKNQLENNINILNIDITSMREQNSQLEEEKQQFISRINILTDENRNLNTKNDELKSENRILIDISSRIKSENKEIKKTISNILNKYSSLANQNIQLLNDNENLERENNQLNQSKEELSAKIKIIKSKNQKLINKSCDLEKEIETLSKINDLDHLKKIFDESNVYSNQIGDFLSHFSLRSQHIIFTNLALQSQNNEEKQFLISVNKLINYLLKFKYSEPFQGFEIMINNYHKCSSLLNNEYGITILPATLQMLYQNNSLKSQDFINILKEFNKISIQMNYGPEFIYKIYENVLDIKNYILCQNDISIDFIVTELDDESTFFVNEKNINSIKIAESVTRIGDYAFKGCLMKKVILPSTIESIGSYAFLECSLLTEITIPPKVTKIEKGVFQSCILLRRINIPDSVIEIDHAAFQNCKSLININIPYSLTEIKSMVFSGCSSLKSITIPFSVRKIGDFAFKGCESIEYILLPSNCSSIGNSAFCECKSLHKIQIPSTITEIEPYTFSGCINLKYVSIPNSITVIGKSAFYNCNSLKHIKMSKNVTQIEPYAFYCCKSLTEINIPLTVKEIGEYSFSKCENLKDITNIDSVEYIQKGAFDYGRSLKFDPISINENEKPGYSFLFPNLKPLLFLFIVLLLVFRIYPFIFSPFLAYCKVSHNDKQRTTIPKNNSFIDYIYSLELSIEKRYSPDEDMKRQIGLYTNKYQKSIYMSKKEPKYNKMKTHVYKHRNNYVKATKDKFKHVYYHKF